MSEADKQIKFNTREFSHPLTSGIISILTQNGNVTDETRKKISIQQVADDIRDMVKKMQEGDTTDLLTVLVSNNVQLQTFNQTITSNLTGDVGKQLDNYELLSRMQSRVMNDMRKNIVAINDICNPKRTTFIKEANQHNHLHQENLEKKLKNQNELQKSKQLKAPAVVEDVDIQLKDKVK